MMEKGGVSWHLQCEHMSTNMLITQSSSCQTNIMLGMQMSLRCVSSTTSN